MLALHVLYGYETGYRLEKLPELGELVSTCANIPIHRNKPVLGGGNFTRESGIGVNYVVEDPLVMFGTHPALTGRKGEVVLGKKSGKASIHYKLKEMGIEMPEDLDVDGLLTEVKQLGIAKKDILTDSEFLDLLNAYMPEAEVQAKQSQTRE